MHQWYETQERVGGTKASATSRTPHSAAFQATFEIRHQNKGGNTENATLDLFSRPVTRRLHLGSISRLHGKVLIGREFHLKNRLQLRESSFDIRAPVGLTGFEAGLVDFNLSSDWLLVFQVRKVFQLGAVAGSGTGVAVGEALPGTVSPPA